MSILRVEHTWVLLLPGAVALAARSLGAPSAWYAASLVATGFVGAWQGWRLGAGEGSRLAYALLGAAAAVAASHSIAHAESRGCCATLHG